MNYLYGFASATFAYWALSYIFPAQESLLDACIYDAPDIIDSGGHVEQIEQDRQDSTSQEKRSSFTIRGGQV